MATARQTVVREFRRAKLADERLTKRLRGLASQLAANPMASFPTALKTEAELEGAYRFFNNARVTAEAILEPHIVESCRRALEAGEVLAIQDTSLMEFHGEVRRTGLGPLRKRGKGAAQGFLAHVTLGVAADGSRDPLGVLAMSTLVRGETKKKRSAAARRRDPDNESGRWTRHVGLARERVGPSVELVHVMDREGDSYGLIAAMVQAGERFVVRAAHDRAVSLPPELRGSAKEKLSRILEASPIIVEREVFLSRRRNKSPGAKRINPDRDARTARLAIRGVRVVVPRSQYADRSCPAELSLNVVHVVEVDAPAGDKPVEWVLLTTKPIDSPEHLLRVVDIYRARWLIEEFFKALKTGCRYEQRQLESLHALVNALAVLMPIAWQMLRARFWARTDAQRPAHLIFAPTTIEVLRAVCQPPLPPNPTVREALLAVARLGGHLKRNGEPGWQVLMQGARDLAILELGWRARRKHEASSTRKAKM